MAFALGLAVVSCNKALEKAEVEKGFAPKGEIPTVTTPVVEEIVPVDKKVVVSVTFSGYSETTDSLELGFLVSTDPTFATSKAVIVDPATIPADGKVTAELPVTIATKNYVRATASSISGSNFSETVEVDVPSIPWHQAMAASYTGDAYSYWDETDCSWPSHTIEVAADAEANTVTFTNFDAFAVSKKFPSQVTGVYDDETRTVTFELAEDSTFDVGLGAAGVVAVPMTPDFENAESYSVVSSADYTQMTVQPYGLNGGGSWYEIYYQTTYVAK